MSSRNFEVSTNFDCGNNNWMKQLKTKPKLRQPKKRNLAKIGGATCKVLIFGLAKLRLGFHMVP